MRSPLRQVQAARSRTTSSRPTPSGGIAWKMRPYRQCTDLPVDRIEPTNADGSVAPYVAHQGGPYRPSLPGARGRGAAIPRNPTDDLLIIRPAEERPPGEYFLYCAQRRQTAAPRGTADAYRLTGISTGLCAVAATDVPATALGYLPRYRIGKVDATDEHAAIEVAPRNSS